MMKVWVPQCVLLSSSKILRTVSAVLPRILNFQYLRIKLGNVLIVLRWENLSIPRLAWRSCGAFVVVLAVHPGS